MLTYRQNGEKSEEIKMKPIFTKIIATAETTEQTAAATKIVLDNIQYLDKIEFIKHSGYIMVSITIKNKIYNRKRKVFIAFRFTRL